MKITKLLTLPFLFISQVSSAEVSCGNDRHELSIERQASGYSVSLVDVLGSKMSSVDFLREQFPRMEEELLQIMANRAKDMGKTDLKACSKMDLCTFNDPSSDSPVSCTRESDEANAKFKLFYSEGALQARCTSNGTFEVSNSIFKATMTGKRTVTFGLEFLPTECTLTSNN